MNIPQIDYDIYAKQMLPPTKRAYPFWYAWVKALVSQSKRLNGIFSEYINGNTASYYNGSTVYNNGDEAVYNYQTYKSMVDGNTGNIPDQNTDKWLLISPSIIGTKVRTRFCYPKLTLEYALNLYFQKALTDNGFIGFKQPDSAIAPTPSDINITNVTPTYTSFFVFADDIQSDDVYLNDSTGAVFDGEIISGASTYEFNVNIPSAVYVSINATAAIADTIIRQFLDKYVVAGVTYNIVTY